MKKILSEKITIKEGEKKRRVTKMDAMLRSVALQAMKGDARAIRECVALAQEYERAFPEQNKIIVEFVRAVQIEEN
jgi:hypothetical protein